MLSVLASITPQAQKTALIMLFVIFLAMAAVSIVFTLLNRGAKIGAVQLLIYIVTVVVLICCLVCLFKYISTTKGANKPVDKNATVENENTTDPTDKAEDPTDPTNPVDTKPNTDVEKIPEIHPAYTDVSNPENWGVNWEIIADEQLVESYKRPQGISFGDGKDYFSFPGIATFRGNNYRNGAFYGTADVKDETLTTDWSFNIGGLSYWTGSGWTGQPLMVQWDEATKSIMNMYESKKSKENLVEVIHATLDGKIYFYDLDDGEWTRDPINVGMPFKGAGSLDPRGYPLMYVGSGDSMNGYSPRMYIISLIDGTILHERSGNDTYSKRSWCAFDSSPLVDAETDTLIWPGESGVLYTMDLNTEYDRKAGTISVEPEEVAKTRYYTSRSNNGTYWVGYEPSAVIVDRYLYISENGGMFFCVDLDTMELVWAQDTKDDSNSTPVFQWEDGKGYIYTAPSLHWTASGSSQGKISIYKLDAATGEIVWELPFDCYTVSEVSGGIQSSPLLGQENTDLEGLIIYTVARTPSVGDGALVAVDTKTGEIVWEIYMHSYSWSSPVALYTAEGKSYIVVGDSASNIRLIAQRDGKGEVIQTIGLGANIEASPAAFNNTIVIGTRGQKIYGLKLS